MNSYVSRVWNYKGGLCTKELNKKSSFHTVGIFLTLVLQS